MRLYDIRLYDIAKIVGIASALLGAIGSFLLYTGTFGFEAPSPYASAKFLADMKARNRRRYILQRIGFGLLMLSFALGGISVCHHSLKGGVWADNRAKADKRLLLL